MHRPASVGRVTTYVIGVATGLSVAGIIAAAKWLTDERHREDLGQWLRHTACGLTGHDWQPYDPNRRGWPGIVVISPHNEECGKCGKTR
jgi:hypothetical protein